ncbi:Phosphoinositide 4-kinase gamma 4 gamma 4 ubdk gamma 4 pi4k gamma 4 [Tripterygium wilfordii]|uniref:1-phosphatidylinositol 4-kinase n=1 Tax=Tripterygium wilfordii TaxID=458696 RepID=A0A7J7CLP3_TRIWF|nr:phosphatidylinositol 4-kinase gamma 2-like [Tripterygium wilfordii]KAF5734992.1 Phosphoinositide 4-kinase gamma 4 gamma 4 ubdk gamma 4 pi4k gamma 4 [Tripterygium wilfordii]
MSAAGVALSPVRPESVRSSGCGNNKSILIYISVAGSVIPMRVLDSDSIASVKVRIQTCKGFVVKKQKLVFGGRELAWNDSLVKDYGVAGGNVLHLVLKLSDLLLITVRTVCGKEFELQVDRYRKVKYLKQRIAKEGKGFVDVEHQEIFCDGERLDDDDDQRTIADILKDGDAVIHLLAQKSAKVRAKPIEKDFELSVVAENSNEKEEDQPKKELQVMTPYLNPISNPRLRDFWLEPVIVNPKLELDSVIWDMINSTFDGLEKGNTPIRSSEGTGGTYLMQDSMGENYVSVFKPIDEEPNAVNNPHDLPVSSDGEGLKRGTVVGEGALREVAAYILDHPRTGPRGFTSEVMGFAGVPPTTMVRCLHAGFNHPEGFEYSLKNAKIGSLQMFVKNSGSCEDIGPGAFPKEEVHKISVFDIRMANADRHSGNILIGEGEEGQTVLIPIDHGYCLPENFGDCTFDWLYWPQARQPYSASTIDYIKSLDAEQDIAILKYYGWDVPLKCARTLRISTMLLKKGVEKGLTPFAIGSILCRKTMNQESVIEGIVLEAEDSMLPGMSEAAFLETVSQIMDSQLEKITE